MNNWGLFNSLYDFFENQSQAEKAILIFIFLNFLMTIFNSWIQFRLKSKDQKIIGFQIREERRIKVYEDTFAKIQELNYFDPQSNNTLFLKKISNFERLNESNRLYLCSKTQKMLQKLCDYYKIILTDFRKKDLSKEEQFIKTFKSFF
jgi:hypothetical protein